MKERKQAAASTEETIGEVVLRFVEGENEGVEIRVTPPRKMVIGRSEACDIFLGEKKISRKHCELDVTSEGVRLIDNQSTNGTFVNGKKIAESKIKDQDKIRCGNSVIQVEIHSSKALSVPKEDEAEDDEEESVETGTIPATSHESARESKVISGFELSEPSGVSDLSSEESFSLNFGSDHSLEQEVEEEVKAPAADKKPKNLSGNLSAMGLADLLQNLAHNQKSGSLRLDGPKEGRITVLNGKVLAADVGSAKGVKALYRMLGWNEGEFELEPLPEDFDESSIKTPIKDSTEKLLMEGFRQFDELEKIRKGLPSQSARLRIKPKFTAPLSKLHPRVLDVLQLVLNEEKFEAVLDKSAFSDLETSKIVYYLLKKEYIIEAK